tara:strand:- start:2931 stop:4010 length:1080 start_codon:yes stop_codon:yes gene_type:complete
MANYFTRFLTGAAEGLSNPKGQQANWQHATRLFIDDTMRLAPRSKFLFYVRFEMNKDVIKAPAFNNKHSEEVGLLVKTAELPKYSFDTVTKNQYNRKKIVYKQINYDPVNLTMHDDSGGVVNAMWALYYGYYIADRHLPSTAYESNHFRPVKTSKDLFRYGMDHDITSSFFNSVTIYTMSRKRFLGYTLINPKIKSWAHSQGDYATSEFMESQMQLEYEAVKYSTGDVKYGTPKGFATLHYDSVPSPITVAGGGVSALLGDGGVLDGLETIFGEIGSGAAFDSPAGFLSTAIKTINTYKNAKNLTNGQLKSEAINILTNPAVYSGIASTVSGVVGAVFPKSTSTPLATQAVQKNLLGPN